MNSERKPPEPAASEGEPTAEIDRSAQTRPEQEAGGGEEAEPACRKPFDDALPNIEPLPGEPPKWWNP